MDAFDVWRKMIIRTWIKMDNNNIINKDDADTSISKLNEKNPECGWGFHNIVSAFAIAGRLKTTRLYCLLNKLGLWTCIQR